jgi:hypothetical protein
VDREALQQQAPFSIHPHLKWRVMDTRMTGITGLSVPFKFVVTVHGDTPQEFREHVEDCLELMKAYPKFDFMLGVPVHELPISARLPLLREVKRRVPRNYQIHLFGETHLATCIQASQEGLVDTIDSAVSITSVINQTLRSIYQREQEVLQAAKEREHRIDLPRREISSDVLLSAIIDWNNQIADERWRRKPRAAVPIDLNAFRSYHYPRIGTRQWLQKDSNQALQATVDAFYPEFGSAAHSRRPTESAGRDRGKDLSRMPHPPLLSEQTIPLTLE